MSRLKELQELSLSQFRDGRHRCSICNIVNNESIETEIGDYHSHMSFTADPKDPRHFICISCSESINDQLREFDERDDYYLLNN